MGVSWKIRFLRDEGLEKPIYRVELPKMVGAWIVRSFKGAGWLGKKRGSGIFVEWGWYYNAHYDDKILLLIFPKMLSEIFNSEIC